MVVDNGDGTYDGICAGAAIGGTPKIYPQATAVSQYVATSKVEKKCNEKKREYTDDPGFLIGLNRSSVANIRATAAAQRQLQATPTGTEDPLEVIWPMLAPNEQPNVAEQEEMLDSDEWRMEEKWDGERKEAHIGPWGIRFTSRNGGVNSPDRPLEKQHPHLNHMMPKDIWATVPDGETIGSLPADHHLVQKGIFKKGMSIMVLYDLVRYKGKVITDKGENWPDDKRRQALEEIFAIMRRSWEVDLGQDPADFPFYLTPQAVTKAEKRALLEEIKATWAEDFQGHKREGVMFKKRSAVYYEGLRPSDVWRKVKEHIETDVIITGFDTEGRGANAGMIKSVKFGQYVPQSICQVTGVKPIKQEDIHPNLVRVIPNEIEPLGLCEFGKVSGMSLAVRKDMTANPDNYIGKVMKISAMSRYDAGTFRHPQFEGLREDGDKAATECVWEG